MTGKNNLKKQYERRGEKVETYSIKKLKAGAASVLIGVGLFFGTGVVEASDNATVQQSGNKKLGDDTETSVSETTSVEVKPAEKKAENTGEKAAEAVAEKLNPQTSEKAQTAEKTQQETDKSLLLQKIEELKAQLERIKNNSKQQSMINDATSKLATAEALAQTSATQQEVDKKAKEISSLTVILKSIKAEETVKENKNQDSRNDKKMQEGTGFRDGGAAGTGVGADVEDATSKPKVERPGYTDRELSKKLASQVTWLDFSDESHWHDVDKENGKIYLKEGSYYETEVYPGYSVKVRVKSLKPFQATEIYRKRMENRQATDEEKATFDPNATNTYLTRNYKAGADARISATEQGQFSTIKRNGFDTGNKKTTIAADDYGYNWGVQFDVSATYNGHTVRPAVLMTDGESANPGENIIFTTNGDGWKQIIELEKIGGTTKPFKPTNLDNLHTTELESVPGEPWVGNWNDLKGMMDGTTLVPVGKAGKKIAPKYFASPDQENGGLGTGVFGPVVTSDPYSVPVVMTKGATEIGMYVLTQGMQSAMMGIIPIDEGDAPESYGEAVHVINKKDTFTGATIHQPYLGSKSPDPDTKNTKNWLGDDMSEDADEGVKQLLPDNLKESEGNIIKANISKPGSYTLNVQANRGGADKAYIRSWIDFNEDGHFDADEASEIAEITQDGTVELHFKNKPSINPETLLEAGTRVRISTERSEIENPTGTAFSGEVEDFVAKITHPPKGEKITSIGNTKETQRGEINFTAQGKNVYLENHPKTEIDTTVQPTYIDNKTGQVVTLTTDGTYTVEGQGTYKFTTTTTGATVTVEFTPVAGFVGKADGISIRRQDTNKTTTDWGVYNPTNDPSIKNVNDVLNSMDGLYIPEVTVSTSANNAASTNLQGLTQKGQPTFNVETSSTPVTASATHPAKLVDPRTGTVTTDTTVDALEEGTTNKIGTYTIAPETGEVTFTPNKDFTGIPAPATISVEVELGHDKAGDVTKQTLTGTYTPTIIQVTPTGTPVNIKGIQGATQEGIPTFTPGKGNIGTEEHPVEKSVPMDTTAYKLLGGENGKTPLDEVPAMSEDGTKQVGTYTISVVEEKPVVTFTPTDKTYVGKLKSVTVQGKDTNGTKATATYTVTVIGVTPTGTNASSEGIQGSPQNATVTFAPGEGNIGTEENPVKKSVSMDPTAYKLLGGENGKTPLDEVPAMSEDGKKQVGTYTISVVEGKPVVTFTPTDKTYAGKLKPVTVQGKDTNGTEATATYTPVVKAAVPTVEIPKTTDVQGAVQTVTPVFTPGKNTVNNQETEVPFESTSKAKLIDPSKTGEEAEVISLEIPKQGTYTIDDSGVVTFTPLPTFKGEATGVTIVRKDKNGTPATATYSPSVVGVTPTGTNASSEGIQGSPQNTTVTFTPGEGNIGTKENPVKKSVPITISATNPAKFVVDGQPVETTTIPAKEGDKEVGTYTIEPATGKVTFTPNKDYSGTPTPVTVQAKDDNGTPATATYTPVVKAAVPTVEIPKTTDVQGAVQTVTPVFTPGKNTVNNQETEVPFESTSKAKLIDPSKTGEEAEVISLEIPKQGTYTIDDSGVVTFTPLPTFKGEATGVTIVRKDKNGTPATATYSPSVVGVTPTGTNASSEGIQGSPQEVTVTFTPGKGNIGTEENPVVKSVPMDPTAYKLLGGENGTTPLDEVPAMSEDGKKQVGTYTISVVEGKPVVTFTPTDKTYAGKLKPVTVQGKDTNGTEATATYTPTVRPDTKFVVIGKDGKETELSPSKDGKQPEEKIAGYKVVKTETDKDGNTKYIYEKVTTSLKDKEGNEIPNYPTEEGDQPKKDIPGYKFVETKKLPNGDVEHVYEKVEKPKEIIRDKDGNPIPGFEYAVMSPTLDIPEYVYVETVTDPDGTVRHIYRPVETVRKDKDGNPIPNVPTKEKGTKGSKGIPGYRLVETKKLPNGDVEHVYEKVKGTTTWVDEYGNVLISKEEGILDPTKVSGYEFVRTDVDKEGNVRHVFKKVSTSPSPVSSVTISWTDEEGNPIKVTENGTRGHGVIPGYEYVRTVTDKNGNVRHIFRKVTPGEEKVQVKRLANTGTTETNTGLAGLGFGILGGLLAATKRRKNK